MFFALILVALVTVLYTVVIFGLDLLFPMIPDIVPSLKSLLERSFQTGLGSLVLNVLSGIPILLLLLHAGPYKKDRLSSGNTEMLTGDQVWRTI